MLYLKRGAALAREMKWLRSYRYAVINLGAPSEEELERRYAQIRSMLYLDDATRDADEEPDLPARPAAAHRLRHGT
jgi:hypothetical protein